MDPRKDPLMRINAQGDWTGITQQQADQIVWDNRDEILTRASYDSELSTWTLHQLDQLKEPQPAQSLDRDRPEPDHKRPHRPIPRRSVTGQDCSPLQPRGGALSAPPRIHSIRRSRRHA